MSVDDTRSSQHNQAQNDKNKWHTCEVNKVEFTVPLRYQELKYIGSGSYGIVASAKDTILDRRVAIKKLLAPFDDGVANKTYRETNFLIYLNHNDSSTVQLFNVFTPDADIEHFRSLYFVHNYFHYNLHEVIERHGHFTEDDIQHVIYSILRGLKYIHSAGIIHRDIKPTNIGVDKKFNISILDFGLSRTFRNESVTGYVCTRWWRAPEVLVTWEHYTPKVDVWSVGCIMAELILREPFFQGKDKIDQLKTIMSIVGTPSEQLLLTLCDQNITKEILRLGQFAPKDFNVLFGYKHDSITKKIISGVGDQGVRFLHRLLNFNPNERPSVEEALNDPFLADNHNPDDEPVRNPPIDAHGNVIGYSIRQWKELTWNLIQNFVPPAFAS